MSNRNALLCCERSQQQSVYLHICFNHHNFTTTLTVFFINTSYWVTAYNRPERRLPITGYQCD